MLDILISMLDELQGYKGTCKSDLLYKYIRERLDKSYCTYIKELKSGTEYLERRNERNVLKKINNYDKKPTK